MTGEVFEKFWAAKRIEEAAPDLLAACEAQADIIQAQSDLLACYRIGRRPSEKTMAALEKLDLAVAHSMAAIKKATGRS